MSAQPQAQAGERAPLALQVYLSPMNPIPGPGDRWFSPVTSTLIAGETDAVLVDSGFIKKDIAALGDFIAASGKRLTTIFVTHGHADHFYGSALLAERFPGVQVVALPAVVADIATHLEEGLAMFRALFGDAIASPDLLPTALDGDTIELEGHHLKAIEIGQGDIAPSTILQVPELNALIVGDIGYNQFHQMLAFGGPREWQDWIASVDKLEGFNPKTIVVGHRKPEASDDDVAGILNGTRQYIRDFAAAAETATSARDIVAAMLERYPDHGNPTALHSSAAAAMKRKEAVA